MNTLLEVQNLVARTVETNKLILRGLNLKINEGEIHAIMGPNGSGKSTFSKVLSGHPFYKIDEGNVYFKNKNLLLLEPEQRAQEGLFLAFQYPVEIPGVSNEDFLRLAYNSIQKAHKKSELDPLQFFKLIQEKMKNIEMDFSFLSRNVNEGFSGGEKKRNEILQLSLLNPDLTILDETDSGLDIDALRVIGEGINKFMDKHKAIIVITHYQRLLEYIQPNYVHVMVDGKIIKTGDKTLVEELEKKGYSWLKN